MTMNKGAMGNDTLHVYTRVSTYAQQEEGTSLKSQEDLGIKKAKELGFEHKLWNEGGASSNCEDLQNRPVMLALLEEIKEGNVKHLWVYENDRLSRNDMTASMIRASLKKNGVILHTRTGQFDLSNPHDKFFTTLLDEFAQLDNAQRAERTRLGKLNRVKEDFWMGGPPPYGYQITNKKLVLHPEESQWVKKIYEWYANGKSIQKIKSELDINGVQTRRKRILWSLGSIRKILMNTHPMGEYAFVDSKTDETVKCTCPRIVSKTLWNKCQKTREDTFARKGQKNRTKHFYLLRDIMYCGHCGSHMAGRIKPAKNENVYYCPRKERQWVNMPPSGEEKWVRGRHCSMTRSLNISATDDLVTDVITDKVLLSQGFHELLSEHLKTFSEGNYQDRDVELKKLKNKEKRLIQELKTFTENIIKVETARILGEQDKEIAKGVLKNLYSMKNEKEAALEQCRFVMEQVSEPITILTKELFSVMLKTEDLFRDAVDKKDFIERFVDRIDVSYNELESEHKLVLKFRIPLNISRANRFLMQEVGISPENDYNFRNAKETVVHLKKKMKNSQEIKRLGTPQENHSVTVE